MGALTRCLCLVLTLVMAGSRAGTAIKTGASSPRSPWGPDELRALNLQAFQAAQRGDYVSSGRLYQTGYSLALRVRNDWAALRFLLGIAGSQLGRFEYTAALDTYLSAVPLSEQLRDSKSLALIRYNLSVLYLEIWDIESAKRQAEECQRILISLPAADFMAELPLQLGRVYARLGSSDLALDWLRYGIEAARSREADIYGTSGAAQASARAALALEADGWWLLGELKVERHDVEAAYSAALNSYRLRKLFAPQRLPLSYAQLGALELARGDASRAQLFTRLAMTSSGMKLPAYRLTHQQGKIALIQDRREAALREFKASFDLALEWRAGVLPDISALDGASTQLEQQVYRDLIELGADYSLAHAHEPAGERWKRESFLAVEINRASSLRQDLALREVWRKRLPKEYWAVLSVLRDEEGRALLSGRPSPASDRLHLRLSEMEAHAASGSGVIISEIFRNQSSLNHFRHGLRQSELLLSFHLGTRCSYLWAITRESVALYTLPAASTITATAQGLREALEEGSAQSAIWGERAYRELFGALGRRENEKPDWLLSLDDALFELPFAALVTDQKDAKPVYLIEKHSLQVVPGALLLSPTPQALGNTPHGWFLGVGDPVYNAADPRYEKKGSTAGSVGWLPFARGSTTDGFPALARLVESGREVDQAARGYSSAIGAGNPEARSVLLTGRDAQRDRFLSLLAGHPSVVHLATHVLVPPVRHDQAFIAFSLGPHGTPEYLATSDVAALNSPGALVALTGCDTAAGEVRAGVGLIGLSRAWLMAGATSVLATQWSVRDFSGDLLPKFYQRLGSMPAARALQLSQVDMIRSGSWRASPSYWAAYMVTGGGH